MNKELENMTKEDMTGESITREELETVAKDYGVTVTPDMSDGDLLMLVGEAMSSAEQVKGEDIENLSHKELQKLAKELGIPVNQKTSELKAAVTTEIEKRNNEAENGKKPEDKAGEQKNNREQSKSEKLTLSDLAFTHNLPSWQKALIMRANGWEDDKLLGTDEFADAVKNGESRPLGGY